MASTQMARSFVQAALATALVLTMAADAGLARPPRVIAYVGSWTQHTDSAYERFVDAMRRNHPELSTTLVFQYVHGADSDQAALEAAISSAMARHPAVLVTPTGDSARAARRLSAAAPVVFASHLDPIKARIVDSMRAPGGRITGVSLADWLHMKRLELLRDAYPDTKSVAILADQSWAEAYEAQSLATSVARQFGLEATLVYAEDEVDVDKVMLDPSSSRFDAWYIPPTYVAYRAEARIIGHLARLGKPAIHSTSSEVRNGALMAYEQDTSFVFGALANLVSRICAGEDPASIPIERPRRYVLSVRSAWNSGKAPMEQSVVRRADQVF